MLYFLPAPVRGAISFVLMVINTIVCSSIIFLLALLKLLIPLSGWRALCGRMLNGIASAWISINNQNLRLTNRIEWEVSGLEGLSPQEWYLVIANHQSWSDILVLQKVFNRKIPFLKFFLKQELIWVPVIGLVWWALDYPFMKRYPPKVLERRPELKGKDLETTRRACEKFKTIPVSIMNFVEGTRFTPQKHAAQGSPYQRLLKPKAAGIAFVLAAMGEELNSILDVTIAYPGGARDLWPFLCGRAPKVRIRVTRLPIGPELRGDYFNDEAFRARFQQWINGRWSEKDRELAEMAAKT